MMDFKKIASLKEEIKNNPRRFLLLGAGIGIFLLVPLIGGLILRIAHKKESDLAQKTKYETNRNALLKEIDRSHREFGQYKKRFAPTAETVWLMNRITELASSEGLTLQTIQPEKIPPSLKLKGVAVKIAFRCGYHQLGAFVEAIENFPVFLRIQELKLERVSSEAVSSQPEDITGRARVEMVVHAFSLEEK